MKHRHFPPAPVPATYLSGTPSPCTPAGTSMLPSHLLPGTSHHSGTPCPHMATLLQDSERKREREGINPGAGLGHGILCTHSDAGARQRAQLRATNAAAMFLATALLKALPWAALSSPCTSRMAACGAGRFSLPSPKVNSLLTFSTGVEAHQEPNALVALHQWAEASGSGNQPPWPLPGTGRVPAGFARLGTRAPPAKAGPPSLLFKHYPPAFLT